MKEHQWQFLKMLDLNVKLKLKANVILFLFWQVRLRKQGFSMFTTYTLYDQISVAAKGHKI